LEITKSYQTEEYPYYAISFTLTDTSSGDVLLSEDDVSFYSSTYTCISNEDVSLTLVWGSEMVLLVNYDYKQKYTNISGIYSLTNTEGDSP
jgi:hypothetical protein